MPVPVLVIGLTALAAAALAASSSKKGDTTTNPNPLFDVDLPPNYRKTLEDNIRNGASAATWPGIFLCAYQMQLQGYPKSAQAMLAVANVGRQQAGLAPIAYPLTAESYAKAAAESGTSPAGPGVPGPGGTAYGVPPKADVIPAQPPPPAPPPKVGPGQPPSTSTPATDLVGPAKYGPPGATPASAPPGAVPPGYVKVTTPDGTTMVIPIPTGLGNPFPIPPGVFGTPPPAGPPPASGPPASPPPYVPPKPAKVYPVGTHTRPDGTYGYTTQKGDYSTVKIASHFKGQNTDLIAANPGTNWSANPVGSDLNIPLSWVDTSSPPPPGPRGKAPPGQKSAGKKADDGPGLTVEGPPQGDILPGLKDTLKDLGAVDVKAKRLAVHSPPSKGKDHAVLSHRDSTPVVQDRRRGRKR